jgi:hypothetical protein
MKPVLIVQFKSTGRPNGFDWLINIEDTLIQAFSQNNKGEVDGHDFGPHDMNIFVFPKGSWQNCLEIIKAHLKHKNALSEAVIILRNKSEKCSVVFPENFVGEFTAT